MSNQRWTIDKFLPLYLQAAAEGITKEEFAEQLGLKPDTVYQRVYALRRKGADIPLLKSAGKVPLMEQATKIIADFKLHGPMAAGNNEVNEKLVEAAEDNEEPASDDIESVLGIN